LVIDIAMLGKRCTYIEGVRDSCACTACRIREEQRAARSRAAAEEAGFWPDCDEDFLDDSGYLERFDIAARIQSASNMIVFANDVVKKQLPNTTPPQMRAGLAYPLYEVPGLHMHASTLRCIRCVTALARILLPSASVYFMCEHYRSLLIRRVLSSYFHRAQVLPLVCCVCCACFVNFMCSVLWQLYLFVALTIAFTGIVNVSVQLLFLVPGD
jgi:hypothetical protein